MSIILIFQMALNMVGINPEEMFKQELEKTWYASPIVKVGDMASHSSLFIGVQGGMVYNQNLALGGKSYFLTNPFEMQGMQNINIGFGCIGVFAEYTLLSNDFYHISIENMIGVGGIYNTKNEYIEDTTPVNSSSDMCFVMEPGVKMNLEISDNFQLAAGLNYRFIGGVDYDAGVKDRSMLASDFRNLSNADIEGLSFQIELKMGRF